MVWYDMFTEVCIVGQDAHLPGIKHGLGTLVQGFTTVQIELYEEAAVANCFPVHDAVAHVGKTNTAYRGELARQLGQLMGAGLQQQAASQSQIHHQCVCDRP